VVVGNPTNSSLLSCYGAAGLTPYVYPGGVVYCVISIRDDVGSTIGFSDDFARATSVGGSSISLPASVANNYSVLTFTLSAPVTAHTSLTITGNMKDLSAFAQGPVSVLMMGTPSIDSLLSCVSVRSGTVSTRINELVNCTITVKDGPSSTTTSLASDFQSPALVGGTLASPVASSNLYTLMTFTVLSPSSIGTTMSVTGRLSNGLLFSQGAFQLAMMGTPTVASTVACRGMRSQTPVVRIAELVLCNITIRDNTGITTADLVDFDLPYVEGGQLASAMRLEPATAIAFNVTAPNQVGAAFSVTGVLAGGANFSQGKFAVTVVGTPTAQSSIQCVGIRSGSVYVRVNETVACTVYIRDGVGPTTGVATDFAALVTNGGVRSSAFVSSNDYSMVYFNVTAPSTKHLVFSVIGALSWGVNFTQGFFDLTVVGTPDVTSSLSCVGARSQTTFVRVSETVICNITARDSVSFATASVPQDFGYAVVVNGQSVSAVIGPMHLSGKHLMLLHPAVRV